MKTYRVKALVYSVQWFDITAQDEDDIDKELGQEIKNMDFDGAIMNYDIAEYEDITNECYLED